ncbi:polysaccharide biosynthesis/export family protein [Sphingomonas mucosissima]|uniref:Polysaccharide biosynthesis/export protein n=1 Tax=Sphingomonas mucosissima TaxID=370959 RepID=A0A245ZQA1_9SPHN|nr:polysaccharide biosynthesis/export family protein [Sphingomonas mucosissima]OWK31922.1 polysaccharide biosynthesis/export protein [Sphingomonas mucosissima]
MLLRPAFLLLITLLFSACAEKGEGPVISAGERYASTAAAVSDYRLGVGDRVRVTVFNEPSLTGEFWVNPDGTVSLPLIGNVPATDRPVSEIARDAQARFADGYLRDPKVAMDVIVFRPFYILGEVGAPGQYPYVNGLTAMNAVALAKGFTPRANRDVIRIRRQGATDEVNYRLTPELIVYPGDTVRIGERFF